MVAKPAGSQWLKEHYKLSGYSLTHISFIGNNASIELTSRGNVEQVYGLKYAPATDIPLSHLEFALKYDDLSLDFLRSVFEKLLAEEISAFIQKLPAGKYVRKIGFLYEFLTGKNVELENVVTANYIDLLEKEKYVTGSVIKNAKWKINNNLLGDQKYSPIVRRTNVLDSLLENGCSGENSQTKKYLPSRYIQKSNQLSIQ